MSILDSSDGRTWIRLVTAPFPGEVNRHWHSHMCMFFDSQAQLLDRPICWYFWQKCGQFSLCSRCVPFLLMFACFFLWWNTMGASRAVNNSSTAIRDEPIKSFVIDQPICWLTKLRAMQFMPLPQDVFYYCWCLHVYPWNEIPCVQAARGRPWTTKVLLFATCSSRSFVKDALQTTMSRTPDNNVENKGIASVFSNLLETCEGLQQHLHLGDEGTILSVKLHILSYNIRIELFVYNAVT